MKDKELLAISKQLGYSLESVIKSRGLVPFLEPTTLTLADRNKEREFLLTPKAAEKWLQMKLVSENDGITIFLVSAFRSIEKQTEIIQTKLNNGAKIEDILLSLAPPGFSEHHTGNAVDIGTIGIQSLQEEFEDTDGFLWLKDNARYFGYNLSYPKDNKQGFVYEPWHWCYKQK